MSKPLTDATKKDRPDVVLRVASMQIAFDQLKSALSCESVLSGPNFDKEFILQTDASDHSIGKIFTHTSDDKSE